MGTLTTTTNSTASLSSILNATSSDPTGPSFSRIVDISNVPFPSEQGIASLDEFTVNDDATFPFAVELGPDDHISPAQYEMQKSFWQTDTEIPDCPFDPLLDEIYVIPKYYQLYLDRGSEVFLQELENEPVLKDSRGVSICSYERSSKDLRTSWFRINVPGAEPLAYSDATTCQQALMKLLEKHDMEHGTTYFKYFYEKVISRYTDKRVRGWDQLTIKPKTGKGQLMTLKQFFPPKYRWRNSSVKFREDLSLRANGFQQPAITYGPSQQQASFAVGMGCGGCNHQPSVVTGPSVPQPSLPAASMAAPQGDELDVLDEPCDLKGFIIQKMDRMLPEELLKINLICDRVIYRREGTYPEPSVCTPPHAPKPVSKRKASTNTKSSKRPRTKQTEPDEDFVPVFHRIKPTKPEGENGRYTKEQVRKGLEFITMAVYGSNKP